eukprot:TRINITY_DN16885_c0_g1_i1.p1 TRINITY_DN16885_c0_g1~~TRINITY_DN16885_c0_g1_i1.p1  ORF type:complete len:308 (+),score=27.92 TRINITY_DN16885_c0_g1_i1:72-995(+)
MVSEWIFGALYGGLGGVAGQLLTNPVDVVKIRLQLHKGGFFVDMRTRPRGWMVVRDVIGASGWSGLWRGSMVAAGHQFVYSSVRLQAYEMLKGFSAADPTEVSFTQRTVIASASGVVATVLSNPLERCKVVIQALPRERCPTFPQLLKGFSNHSYENLKSTWRREQRQRPEGLMGGLGASVQRSAIVHATQLSVYDVLREWGEMHLGCSPLVSLLFASVSSGFISAGVGAPLDVIKTRLMAQQGNEYTGFMDCLVKTVKHEGPLALFKGYLATWLKVGPFTVAQFYVWNTLVRLHRDLLDPEPDGEW